MARRNRKLIEQVNEIFEQAAEQVNETVETAEQVNETFETVEQAVEDLHDFLSICKSRVGLEDALAACKTKSSAIRMLSARGWSTSVIAKKLGIRYQHAYNVLSQPLKSAPAEVEVAESEPEPEVASPVLIEAPELEVGELTSDEMQVMVETIDSEEA